MVEIEFLSVLEDAGRPMRYVDLLNKALKSGTDSLVLDRYRIETLIRNGLAEGRMKSWGTITITKQGKYVLEIHRRSAEEKTNSRDGDMLDKKSKRRSKRCSEYGGQYRESILPALLGGLVGSLLVYLIKFLLGGI